MDNTNLYPEGVVYRSPGSARSAPPWVGGAPRQETLKGFYKASGCVSDVYAHNRSIAVFIEPFQGSERRWSADPGWRASRLPWASVYNPFGVKTTVRVKTTVKGGKGRPENRDPKAEGRGWPVDVDGRSLTCPCGRTTALELPRSSSGLVPLEGLGDSLRPATHTRVSMASGTGMGRPPMVLGLRAPVLGPTLATPCRGRCDSLPQRGCIPKPRVSA